MPIMFNTDDLVTSVGVGEPSNDDDPKLNTSTGSCDVGNLDEGNTRVFVVVVLFQCTYYFTCNSDHHVT